MIKILTVAGSDSGGGAGIQADLKTITMLGAYGASVITSVTAQNTLGVQGVMALPGAFVTAQLDSVGSDLSFDAVKTGMLANEAVIEAVSAAVMAYGWSKLIVDPVMVSTSGNVLLERQAIDCLKRKLLPLAWLVTPNLNEAAVLAEMPVENMADMRVAAERIHALGCAHVLVKGGHLKDDAVDLYFDGHTFQTFTAARVQTENTHGTGCTLSAAIATCCGQGLSLVEAIVAAKAYLTEALVAGSTLELGHGHGPVCHNFALLQ